MPSDDRIDAIFDAQQRLLGEMDSAIQNSDVAAQQLITIKLARLELRLKRIETTHRLMLSHLMACAREATSPMERQRMLMNAFKYAAWVRAVAQDELVDDDLSNEAETQLQNIITGLDAVPPEGRAALAPFLVSHNPDQRVCAAVALLDLMPNRVLPVLRDLAEKEPGTNAGATALDALNKWSDRAES